MALTRFRITVRGDGVELRGYIDALAGDERAALTGLSRDLRPWGLVIASPARPDWDPFTGEVWDEDAS